MKILFLPEVEDYLFELVETLYDKEYFGFKESAMLRIWKTTSGKIFPLK